MKESDKGNNHNNITGDFGENLICYLLSKNNYEAIHAKHTGFDIIAKGKGKKPLGISVKSRSRSNEKKYSGIDIGKHNYRLLVDECNTFGFEPWIAFVLDSPKSNSVNEWEIVALILSLEVLSEYYPNFAKGKALNFSTCEKNMYRYFSDKRILKMRMNYENKPF